MAVKVHGAGDPEHRVVRRPKWQQKPNPGPLERKDRGPIVLTASEIQSYMRCHQAWDFTSPNRQSLTKQGMPAPALSIGSAIHYALNRQWLGHNWLEAVNEHYQATKDDVAKHYMKIVGTGLSSEELAILDQQRWEVQRLLEAYFARYGFTNPTKPYVIAAAEVSFMVPLVADQEIYLAGTLDRIHYHPDDPETAIPGEIKSYRSAPSKELWAHNFQLMTYACALGVLLGKPPKLGLYDGIRKKSPTTPRILKDGTVSKRWVDTTYEEYIRTVRIAHRGRVPAEYRTILTSLKKRDQSPMNAFTTRFRVQFYEHALEKHWDNLQCAAREMANSPWIYANKQWDGCGMCRVRDLCDATYDGFGFDEAVTEKYRVDVSPTRKAIRYATQLEVKTLSDLIEFSRDIPIDPLRRNSIHSDVRSEGDDDE